MFNTDKWREPYHAYRSHPRRELVIRYLEIIVSVITIVFALPYVSRVATGLGKSSDYHTGPNAVRNAYFVLSLIFGILVVSLS